MWRKEIVENYIGFCLTNRAGAVMINARAGGGGNCGPETTCSKVTQMRLNAPKVRLK